MGRYALLIGISNYETDLTPLPSAARDVEALQRVLLNPEIGGFAEADVTVLVDREKGTIETAIYHLFADRKNDDLLLFYFSGHGVTDSRGDFYFTGNSTKKEALPPTAISASYVLGEMNKTRSKRQVVILDCCHSGAFPKGMTAKGVDAVNVLPKLGGEGRAILTASDSTQYAFEQKGFDLSLYTHFLVEGLEKGAADLDGDGEISVDELYDYVREKVKNVNDSMSPEFYPVKEGHRIILAKSPKDDPKLKYRKEVEKVVRRANGKISTIARNLLNGKRIGISTKDAEVIEEETLRPYREYDKKLEEFEKILIDAVAEEYPLSPLTLEELQDYENHLGLRLEDIKAIKNRVIEAKKKECLKDHSQIGIIKAMLQTIQTEEERLKSPTDRQFAYTQAELRQRQTEEERKLLTLDCGNGVALELVKIPAGSFTMGMPAAEHKIALENALKYGLNGEDAGTWAVPQHQVELQAFWMGRYVVTNAQWQAVMGTKPSEKYDRKFQGDKQPVVGVSWHDARAFCQKLVKKIGREMRLPTEAEWEYACRAGTTSPFHFGEIVTPDLVNYNGYYPYANAPRGEYRMQTVDVDSFSPNAWGLHQMHGNVWEWCLDEWHNSYSAKPDRLKSNGNETWGNLNVKGTDSCDRLFRGGSWKHYAIFCRSVHRDKCNANVLYDDLSFRVVVV